MPKVRIRYRILHASPRALLPFHYDGSGAGTVHWAFLRVRRPQSRKGFRGGRLSTDICALIGAADRGDLPATDALFGALYNELHRIARRELARNQGFLSLGATTLLHEAYLDLAGRSGSAFPDRSKFMGYAARVMRGLIIDRARNRRAQKRGGLFEITSLEPERHENAVDCRELTRIADALDELAKVDHALADLVDLKFFCGFSFLGIAAMRGVSERTVQRDWDKARIYLHSSMRSRLD